MRALRLAGLLGTLGVLWAVGGLALFRDLEARRAAEAAARLGALERGVEEARRTLLHEARALAGDPILVAGIQHGEWAQLVRAAGPRVGALASERVADLLLVVDAAGEPVVQVPGGPRLPVDGLGPPRAPAVLLRRLGDRAWLLALAPVTADGRGIGTVAVGRTLESLAVWATRPAPVLVAMAGDEVLGVSNPALAGAGWAAAVRRGRVRLAGEDWVVEPVRGLDGLWAAIPQPGYRGARVRLGVWLALSLLLAMAAVLVGIRPVRGRREPAPAPMSAVAPSGGPEVAPPATSTEAARRLETLVRLTRTLTAPLALDQVLQRVVEATLEAFGEGEARLWLLEEDGDALALAAEAGARGPRIGTWRFRVGEGLVGAVVAGRAPVTVTDLLADGRLRNRERVLAEGLLSFAGVPVVLGGRVLGALTLALRRRHGFNPSELELLAALADHAAAAIDHARRFAEEVTRRAHLSALLEINGRIGAAESPEALLRAIAEEAARLLGVDNAGFRLLEGDELVVAGLAGTAAETMLRARLRVGESLSGRVVAEGRPLRVSLQEAPALIPEHRAADARLGYTHYLGVPVKAGERTVGAFAFRARRPFTARDQELATAFATQAAVVMEQARLAREARRQAERMRALAEVERLISATLDPDAVAERIARSLLGLLGVQSAAVYRLEPETGDLVAIAFAGHVGPTFGRALRFPRGTGASGLAVRERRTVTSPNILEDPAIVLPPEVRARIEAAGYRAVLAAPLRVHDRIIGALGVGDRAGRHFDEEELRLVEAFADQAALVLENARLFALETARRAQIEALAGLQRELAAELELDRLVRLVVDRAAALLGAHGAVYLPEGADTLVAAAWSTDTTVEERLPLGRGVVGRCASERRSLLVNDGESCSAAGADDTARGARRLLACPLVVRDELVGVLVLARSGPDAAPFTDEDRRVLEGFAAQAAVAVENARLYAEAHRRRREAEALASLAAALTERLEVSAVAERIVDGVCALLRPHTVALRRAEPDGSLTVLAGRGPAASPFRPGHRVAPGEGLSSQALARGEPVWSRDVQADPTIPYGPVLRAQVTAAGQRALLAVPLRARNTTVGVVAISYATPRTFTEAEIALVQAFADQAALALDNARLHEEAEQRRREAEALAAFAQRLTETLELPAVGERIVQSVLPLFRAASVGLRMLQADGSLLALSWAGAEEPRELCGHVQPPGTGLAALALAEGRAVWSSDVLADPRVRFPRGFRDRLAALGHRAVLAVPLQARGRMVGVLLVADRTAREFTPGEVALAQAFADQAALALDNARLHEEAEQRRREAEVLAELARSISEALDTDTVLRRVAEGARELCGADLARVALLDPAADAMAFRQWVGARFPDYHEVRIPKGQGLGGLAWLTGRVVRTGNYLEDPRTTEAYREIARAEGVVAELVVPIRAGERVEGLLYVDRRSPRPFTERDEAVLRRLTEHAGVAIQNARLYQGLERYSVRLRTLARVNTLVSSSLDAAELLSTVARAAAELMDGAFVLFWVADEHTRVLHRGAVSDETLAADFPLEHLAFGEGASGWVAAHRVPLAIADVTTDPRYLAVEWARRHGLLSYVGVPLVFRDTLLGVLTVSSPTPRPWTDDEASLLGTFAAQAAVALQHARLHAETQRRLEESRALLEVAAVLNTTLDSRQLLKRVAMKIAQICQVDRCTIERWEGGRVIPLMSQFADGHRDPALWAAFTAVTPYAPGAVPAHARAIATRRPVVIDDATVSNEIPREWVETYGLKSYLVVPLVRQGQVIGVMNLDYCRAVTPFAPWQVELAEAIGGQLALALENTRLYAEAQERLRETTTLLRVAQVLSQPGPLEEALRRVAREVALALDADTVGAYAADEAREALHAVAGYRVPQGLRGWFRSHPLVLARMERLAANWRAGRPTVSPDVQRDPGLDTEWAAPLPPFSTLIVPTRVRGESVGAFCVVWWRRGREVSAAEVRLVEGVASQVGLALENAELARQRELRLRETEVLLEASRTLSSTLEPTLLVRQLMRQIVRITSADSVGAWLLDESGAWLTPWQGYRVPREWLPLLRTLRLPLAEFPFYAEAIRAGRAAWSADALADGRLPASLIAQAPHRGHLFVPIRAKERPVGAFIAVWLASPREFTARELELLEGLGHQAGVALENARLFEQNRRQVEELTVLHELSRAVTGQLDRHALLAALRQQLPRVLPVDRLAVLLLDEATGEFEVVLRLRDGVASLDPPLRYPSQVGLASVVLTTGRPLRTEDYAGECARRGVPLPGPDWPPVWLGVPLMTGERAMGVLLLMRHERPFTDAEERLAVNIADLAALALRSARLFEERTRAYQELEAAQDHLVRTEKLRALGEMASGVAHDFNNLLAAILGRTQLLLRHVQDPRLRQWLHVVERSAQDGAQTVRRLQEFARVRRDTPLVAVDLNAVVRDALEITQSRWREEALRRGLEIRVDTRLAPVPPVAGDPAELREALTNLILNALDAMPEGGTLSITTARADSTVEVAVSDTGVGIPEAIRDRIFDPFFTTKGPQGTGLGLSMTYGIVARHGGRITVESTEGRGSTFRLFFPPLTAPLSPPPPATPSASAPAAALRCLVVDDEEDVGSALGDVLEALGHRAVVLTDGARALEHLAAEPVDVVFTDLAMPGVSGWQVARAVQERWPHIPVFVVTGFGVELSPEERRAHGVAAVYAKPLSIEDITEALARARQAREAPRATEEP